MRFARLCRPKLEAGAKTMISVNSKCLPSAEYQLIDRTRGGAVRAVNNCIPVMCIQSYRVIESSLAGL